MTVWSLVLVFFPPPLHPPLVILVPWEFVYRGGGWIGRTSRDTFSAWSSRLASSLRIHESNMLGCRGGSFYENFWQVGEGREGEEFLKRLAFRVELLRYRGTSLSPSPSIPSHPPFLLGKNPRVVSTPRLISGLIKYLSTGKNQQPHRFTGIFRDGDSGAVW